MYDAEDLLARGLNPEGCAFNYGGNHVDPNEHEETAFELVTRRLQDVLENNYGGETTMFLDRTDYCEAVRALQGCGWKPVNCQGSKKRICKKKLAMFVECQMFYNCATKQKYAFLGYTSWYGKLTIIVLG